MRLTILIRGAAPILCGLLVLGTAACSDPLFDFENSGILDVTDTGPEELPLFLGEPVGGECTEDSDCRDGLVCENDACEPARAKAMNKRCLLSEECAEGLHCGLSGFCVTAGTLDEGAECASSSECMPTMFCEFAGGLTGVCVAHTTKNPKDIGGTCGGTVDCRAGLVCSQSEAFGGTCVAGSLLMNPDLFKGEACERAQDEEAMGFGVRMKVPRGEDVEFYAFPFPSDIHLTDGKVELDGHERPGPGFIGFDTPAAIIDAIEDEMDGFALTPAIFFRFSRAVDPESLAGNVHLIDLDAGTKIDDATLELSFQAERNKYICRNYLYVHPRWSEPLKPGTTYGVYVSADVKEAVAEGGEAGEVKQLDDLDTLLSAEAPSSDTLKVAWESMKPLRAYLGKEKIKLSRVLGATVFTTRSGATTRMEQFAELSKTLGMPEIVADSVTVCDPKEHTASPCATADWELTEKGQAGFDDPRGCPNPNPSDEAKAAGEINPYPPGVIEVHAKVRLPIFQKGEPPYMQGGGDIKVEDGKPVEVRKEEVCVSLSLPLGEMPAGGWPLIIYGHGTGGSFRRGTQLLGTLASCIDTENCERAQSAVMGIDGAMHGPRRGGSDLDPGPLFFNVRNPPAAKGNSFQGAADNFSLIALAKKLKVNVPDFGEVKLDANKIFYVGHSQGGNTGSLFVPFSDDLAGAVLSGTGGSLVLGLMGKKAPYDARAGLQGAFQELSIDHTHPVLHLIQWYFEDTDPLLYAPLLYKRPHGDPLHTAHIYGQNDSYTPPATSRIFAAATGGTLAMPAEPPPEWFDKIEDLGMEAMVVQGEGIKGNREVKGKVITGVTLQALNDPARQLQPDMSCAAGPPYDGHYVLFRDCTLHHRLRGFLRTLIEDGVPTVLP